MKNKGISLIVLIITIIVVIILAGAVLLNLNETNVIDNANQAVFSSDIGSFKVELDLYQMEKYMDNNGDYDPSKLNADSTSATYDGNNLEGLTMYNMIPFMENKVNYVDFEIVGGELEYIGSDANIQNMLAGNDEEIVSGPITPIVAIDTIAVENSTIDGNGFSYNNPVIPVNFKAVNTIDASWDDMEYNNGLVIEDNVGNQFVWVPVDGTDVKYEKDFTYTSSFNASELNTSDDILPNGVINEEDQITSYGGFYIARYEAGNESSVLVSKINMTVFTKISYINSKIKAEEMYDTTEVKSGLVTGKMWDSTMDFITSNGGNVLNSTSWGNYTNSVFPANVSGYGTRQISGYSEYWKVCNIYDLAGNIYEWTNEIYSTKCVYRGGASSADGTTRPVSCRGDYSTTAVTANYIGFRVALYIL